VAPVVELVTDQRFLLGLAGGFLISGAVLIALAFTLGRRG